MSGLPESFAVTTHALSMRYGKQVTQPTAVRRADGKWDVTVPVEAKKFYDDGRRNVRETPPAEHIEIGLFTAEPGRGTSTFDLSNRC